MFRRSLIVWKLSAVFIVIMLVLLIILGYVHNLADQNSSLTAARNLCRFNSTTIEQSIRHFLMTRDNDGVKALFDGLSRNDPRYREIRLVSHTGEVVASPFESLGETLPQESRSCQVCHRHDDPLQGAGIPNHDGVVESPDNERLLSIITPIRKKKSCGTTGCHDDPEAPPVLCFLQTDYSLDSIDALALERNVQTAVVLIIALVLGAVGVCVMVGRILERPVSSLIKGMKTVADGDLGFRFNIRRNDEFTTVAASFNEMTVRLQSSLDELREIKDYLEGIVENSADIIITVDPDGLIRTFNKGAEAALEYDRSEVIGKRIEMLFADPQQRDMAIEQLKQSDHVVNFETRFLTKDGEARDVLMTLSRLRNPDGDAIGTFGISKDLTRVKKLQQQLIQSERFAAIGQSFTGLQHTMKNMLNALKGGSYLVKTGIKKNDQEMLADGWEMVEEGITSITDLSKDMLKYIKNWQPALDWISVGEIIEKIDSVVTQTAADQGVAFNTLVLPELPEVFCDSGLLHSAIMDIVSNALDACTSKEYEDGLAPQIDLLTTHYEFAEKLAIEVRDNGIGMPDNVRENIFTPFFSTKKNRGTGLGMALTARIVNLHGGSLEVVSEPGQGSAFHIILPVAGPDGNRR